ncbi:MAG: nucleoside triphosphate pyrophosphohydrolase [Clostridia bacterium]|nr:nucleoside triphosphate pyrophosphohydrolase [Clostridia bacterium]
MNRLTIVGMGPGSKEFLTLEAYRHLTSGSTVYLRTLKHPIVPFLMEEGGQFETYDEFYDLYDTFDAVYEHIAADVLEKLKETPVTYAVPGNPFVAERTVELLAEASTAEGFEIEYVYGASFIDAMITVLKKDPVYGLRIQDGLKMEAFTPSVREDHIFIQVYDQRVASDIKIDLGKYYPDDYPVTVVRGAGIPGEERIEVVPLYELDRIEWLDYLTSLYVPAWLDKTVYTFSDLLRIMETLRSPDGCPWDREQNHESLMPCFLEETYEALDAIKRYDIDDMIEELGDVLLQIVFHAQLGAEDGYFDIHDIIQGIAEKMVLRHPHVFGDTMVDSSEEVLVNWNKIKQTEKSHKSQSEVMDALPAMMPNLMKAEKLQKIAAKVGFDWPEVDGAVDKLREEMDEVIAELEVSDDEKLGEELGDLIFSIVNVCRMKKISPELALEMTNQKFIDRFKFIENTLENEGKQFEEMTLEELDFIWEKAKNVKK